MEKRAQFFIIASVIILLNLVLLSQNVIRSSFPLSERPLDELAFGNYMGTVIGDISKSPPYLAKRNVWLLNQYLKSASAWKFSASLCCQDECDCASVNLANFTSPEGERATARISSDKAFASLSLNIKTA